MVMANDFDDKTIMMDHATRREMKDPFIYYPKDILACHEEHLSMIRNRIACSCWSRLRCTYMEEDSATSARKITVIGSLKQLQRHQIVPRMGLDGGSRSYKKKKKATKTFSYFSFSSTKKFSEHGRIDSKPLRIRYWKCHTALPKFDSFLSSLKQVCVAETDRCAVLGLFLGEYTI